MTEEVLFKREGSVATLTLNRPDKFNAINAEVGAGIIDAVEKARKDDSIRVLIVTGAGRGFCSGADVRGFAARIAGEIQQVSRRPTLSRTGGYTLALAKLEKPTIAAVNGIAAGIGLTLALVCDIRIVADSARFSSLWVKRGLIPDGGATYLLPRLVGMSKALELMYLGDVIDAMEAERIGLASLVVPADNLMDTVKEMANRIAKGPPIAIELMKRAAFKALYHGLENQLDFESYAQNVCFSTEDHKEGVKSFMEKREPVFLGK